MLGQRLGELVMRAFFQVVEVNLPPAGLVRNVSQPAPKRRELRLKDGVFVVAGDGHDALHDGQARLADRELAQVERGAIPGHVGVIPGYPGDARAIRVPAGLHVEVVPAGQAGRPVFAFAVHDGQGILPFVGVHVEQPAPIR